MAKVKRKRKSVAEIDRRLSAISDAYRTSNKQQKIDPFGVVTIHIDDITIELDWERVTVITDDMEYDAISVAALYAEMVILAAKARKWSSKLDMDKADAYGHSFKWAKEDAGDERRVTDKEAEAVAKSSEDYLMVLEDVEDADFAIRVTEGLMRALNIKAETLRTLLLKAPTI